MAAPKKKKTKSPPLTKLVGEIEDIEINKDYPIFTTGVVCDLLEVNPWFLKQLDDEGIVSPPRDNENATRLYSKNELNKLAYINSLIVEKNLNIEGVKLVFQLQGENISE